MIRTAAMIVVLSTVSAQADLRMHFNEGAPKDRFTLTNTGTCTFDALEVTLDLTTAPAGLIFDVTGAGAGVEVFQPFELVAGAAQLESVPQVLDGDAVIALNLRNFGTGQSVAFTIDVDDTAGGREITVSGSEIAQATLRARIDGQTLEAAFQSNAEALIPYTGCSS